MTIDRARARALSVAKKGIAPARRDCLVCISFAANRSETADEYKSPAHIIRFPRAPQFVFSALRRFLLDAALAEPVLLPSG